MNVLFLVSPEILLSKIVDVLYDLNGCVHVIYYLHPAYTAESSRLVAQVELAVEADRLTKLGRVIGT